MFVCLFVCLKCRPSNVCWRGRKSRHKTQAVSVTGRANKDGLPLFRERVSIPRFTGHVTRRPCIVCESMVDSTFQCQSCVLQTHRRGRQYNTQKPKYLFRNFNKLMLPSVRYQDCLRCLKRGEERGHCESHSQLDRNFCQIQGLN